jgi:predicted PurR-regulated permease PerM/uncharacterized tellurite resistance protein B-like protein
VKFRDRISATGKPIQWAFGRLSQAADLAGLTGDRRRDFNRSIAALFFAVVRADGIVTPPEMKELDVLFDLYFSPDEVALLKSGFANRDEIDIQAECEKLSDLNFDGKQEVIVSLVEIAHADDEFDASERDLIGHIAKAIGIENSFVEDSCETIGQQRAARQTMVRSGAGLLAALIVIAVFILTATFLKSVLFGLVLAYFLLPVQRWYRNTFFPSRAGRAVTGLCSSIVGPFVKTAAAIKRKFSRDDGKSEAEATETEKEQQRHLKEVTRACHATVATLFVLALIVLLGFTGVLASYTGKFYTSAVQFWNSGEPPMSEVDGAIDETPTVPVTDDSGTAVVDQSQVDTADASSWRTFITKMNSKLEALQPRIQQLPGFEWARNKAKVYLQNDQNRSDLIALVLSKSGGLFTATTTFLGNIASFLLNFMLTIFFFSFFLQKISTYDAHGARRRSTGEYLVESIFKSRWLPETSPRALEEAQGIVNEIILKLQIWVKGYLWIIIIESAIYVTLFFILGVPYFAVLGMIAGLTILLPFIGPIASALLTITVFYAVAPPSVAIVLIIVLAYVIMNGVIEQLFLYPALVGEALGLNVLETIIVVLIGGLVAGLAGVIFAVPAASAMKFLIPKLYATWRPATSNPPPEEKRHHG